MISKNSNYAAAESYLTFQHNEYTGLPILDEQDRPKLRKQIYACIIAIFRNSAYQNSIFAICSLRMLLVH